MNRPQQQVVAETRPEELQRAASDPLKSVWVGASAGTGKTKVLIDRVLRLMLPRAGLGLSSASLPDKVLCLTFTKTAAAEMSARIYARLSAWAVGDEETVKKEIAELTGGVIDAEMIGAARRLFARALDTPGGLKIMTIHSFCQSVLRRFPVEAGLPPHFEVMDEASAIDDLTHCLHRVIAEAKSSPKSALASSFDTLALYLGAEDMSKLMGQIMGKRSLLAAIFRLQGDAEGKAEKTVLALHRSFGVDPDLKEKDLLVVAATLSTGVEADLKRATAALVAGSKRDKEKATLIAPWLEAPSRRDELFDDYCDAFFKQDGEIFKTLAYGDAIKICADAPDILLREAERLKDIRDRMQALRLTRLNAALMTLSARMLGHYERRKMMLAKLDYDDLIIKTCDLLAEEGMVPWALYKLDQGIDHILVDEAQDTSRSQWRLVEAISSEFFSGAGAKSDTLRTLFVVGDEKQSIFSFQGADPREFDRMRSFFGQAVDQLQDSWEIVLEHSFRSTAAVLQTVDRVFAAVNTRQGVIIDTEREILHLPFRAGQAGLVELWPLIAPQEKEDLPPWRLPIGIDVGFDAAETLARKIAATIRGWLDSGEKLESRNRPIRAGDTMILVQSRGAFVARLMRALKDAKVPVAGIDRLRLTDEIAIMDLLALAQFVLQPEDDLTLATLLKSPLVGMSEEALFDVCHGRGGSLLSALRRTNPDLTAWLQKWIYAAGNTTPYEFFAKALSAPCFADAISGRRAFYARLGLDIADALDEFLNACLHYEQSYTPALQMFVDSFLRGETEIKREQERAGADQVRILTVHGAKGLQAPIVFLPDASRKSFEHNSARPRLLWPEDERGLPLWSPRKEFDAPIYTALQQTAIARQGEEYRRLLYVALTRAEDRLYVCGYYNSPRSKPKSDSWYHLVAPALEGAEEIPSDGGPTLRIRHAQQAPPEKPRTPEAKDSAVAQNPLPDWASALPEAEPSPPRPLAPSKPSDDEPAAKGPLAGDDSYRFSRGILVHQLLELLPSLPPAAREAALSRYLARPGLGLDATQQKALADEIVAVLEHPEFAAIFGEGSRAEVPVAGLIGAHVLSGQIDRILVTQDEVLIIDYKTNRPPPKLAEDVPVIYLKQMAAYVAAIRLIYPRHAVKCALLWTDGPRLMPLPAALLDRHMLRA